MVRSVSRASRRRRSGDGWPGAGRRTSGLRDVGRCLPGRDAARGARGAPETRGVSPSFAAAPSAGGRRRVRSHDPGACTCRPGAGAFRSEHRRQDGGSQGSGAGRRDGAVRNPADGPRGRIAFVPTGAGRHRRPPIDRGRFVDVLGARSCRGRIDPGPGDAGPPLVRRDRDRDRTDGRRRAGAGDPGVACSTRDHDRGHHASGSVEGVGSHRGGSGMCGDGLRSRDAVAELPDPHGGRRSVGGSGHRGTTGPRLARRPSRTVLARSQGARSGEPPPSASQGVDRRRNPGRGGSTPTAGVGAGAPAVGRASGTRRRSPTPEGRSGADPRPGRVPTSRSSGNCRGARPRRSGAGRAAAHAGRETDAR